MVESATLGDLVGGFEINLPQQNSQPTQSPHLFPTINPVFSSELLY